MSGGATRPKNGKRNATRSRPWLQRLEDRTVLSTFRFCEMSDPQFALGDTSVGSGP
jgi:hypothetical protein